MYMYDVAIPGVVWPTVQYSRIVWTLLYFEWMDSLLVCQRKLTSRLTCVSTRDGIVIMDGVRSSDRCEGTFTGTTVDYCSICIYLADIFLYLCWLVTFRLVQSILWHTTLYPYSTLYSTPWLLLSLLATLPVVPLTRLSTSPRLPLRWDPFVWHLTLLQVSKHCSALRVSMAYIMYLLCICYWIQPR